MPTDAAALRVGYTTGSWDPVDPSHLSFLRRAKELCDRLVVGVAADDLVERDEGHTPGFPLAERMALIGAFEMVDKVVADSTGDSQQAWNELHFAVLFLGADRSGATPGDRVEAALRAEGVDVRYLPRAANRVVSEPAAPSPPPASQGDDFRILVICTANLCRSPMAEYLFRERISAAGMPWTVRSAGIYARRGQDMHPSAVRTLAGMGIAADGFTTTQVDEALLDSQDLILTTTSEQRSWVANLVPRATSRIYVLNQFAHLISAVPPAPRAIPSDRGPELMERVVRGRTVVQPLLGDRDIPDPIGKSLRHFQSCARHLAGVADAFFVQQPDRSALAARLA